MIKLCKYCHKKGKTVWIWTGHLMNYLTGYWQKKLLKHCDFLVEGPFMESLKTDEIPFVGSSNQ